MNKEFVTIQRNYDILQNQHNSMVSSGMRGNNMSLEYDRGPAGPMSGLGFSPDGISHSGDIENSFRKLVSICSIGYI